jgi:NAD(P)-dependent dehydrogenase (short-subunit alcohol dehydrogenase family)
MTLGKDTVFVVTGAAGSITSAITADLAADSGGTFCLLDLVPVPDAENPDLKRFATDKEGLKRDIFERLKNSGERATPARVEKELAALERADAALRAIRAVENAGGDARYHSVDLRDADSVARAIADVRQRSGKIDVLLHAGGLEMSHFLPDKEPAEFDLVFDVKSDGWFNVLHAIGDMPLGTTVGFSSIAGRFGNAGQADYAAANDLLCKTASSFRRTRPATRGIAIDWTAWAGIGMATRGSIPKMMEMASIDMLPPEAGIPFIRHELTAGGRRGEVLVGQRLGILLEEWDAHGGIDPALFAREKHGPMIGRVTGMSMQGVLTVDTELDPARQPFLRDHQIDGTPVLPGVMGVEGFVELARLVTPGWNVVAVEGVVFRAPFKFYRGEPRLVTLRALFVPDGDDLVAECELLGSRTMPNQAEPQVTTHFCGRVRLGHKAAKAPKAQPPPRSVGPVIEADSVYRVYFHGPAYRVLRKVWRNDGAIVGEMESAVPANHEPAELPTQMAPRLIELCFQTAGIWELGTQGRMALPEGIAEIQAYVDPATVKGNLYAVVHLDSGERGFDADVVDEEGRVLVRLRGYRTIALPQQLDDDLMQPMQRAMSS